MYNYKESESSSFSLYVFLFVTYYAFHPLVEHVTTRRVLTRLRSYELLFIMVNKYLVNEYEVEPLVLK